MSAIQFDLTIISIQSIIALSCMDLLMHNLNFLYQRPWGLCLASRISLINQVLDKCEIILTFQTHIQWHISLNLWRDLNNNALIFKTSICMLWPNNAHQGHMDFHHCLLWKVHIWISQKKEFWETKYILILNLTKIL